MFKLSKTLSTVIIGRLDQNMWNLEFSSYFQIFICGFWISKFTFGRFRPEISRSTWFPKRIHLNVFSNQRGSGLSQIQHLYTRFCEKPWKNGFYSVSHVQYSTCDTPYNQFLKVFHKIQCTDARFKISRVPVGLKTHLGVFSWKIMLISRFLAGIDRMWDLKVRTHKWKF